MADSEDEHDRKRRDKFRGERGTGGGESYRTDRRDDRRGGGIGGGRDDWSERNPFRGGAGGGGRPPRPDYRDYRGGGGGGPRDRYGSPPGRDMPPAKRMRSDWGDDLRGGNARYGGYDSYLMHAWNEHYAAAAAHGMHGGYGHGPPLPMPHSSSQHGREAPMNNSDTQTQPAMMTLKQFLDTQDDGISDSEVVRKYSEYKLEFKRQQLNEFFVAHKDEEWFKNKYHPEDSVKRKEEQLGFLQKRVEVFTELLEKGQMKKVSVDTSQTDPLLRLLDTVVIKLEGGTEDDLKVLDEKPREHLSFPERTFDKKAELDDDVIITSVEKKDSSKDEPKVVSPQPKRQTSGSDEENWDDDDDAANKKASVAEEQPQPVKDEEEQKKKEKKTLKRKRTNSESSSSSSSDSDSSSSSSDDDDDDDDDEKVKSKYDLDKIKVESTDEQMKPVDEDDGAKKDVQGVSETPINAEENGKVVSDSVEQDDKSLEAAEIGTPTSAPLASGPETNGTPKSPKSESDGEDKAVATTPSKEQAATNLADDEKEKSTDANNEEQEKAKAASETVTETIDLDKVKDGPQPRALHRTSSIFLRNLAPSITKAEIETVCTRFDGYLRVAIADPLVERRWYRRGWVTFRRDVNIKDICWSLNNTRLKDCEMGAIVNRDLSRRVRPVNGMTAHKTILRADIKLCAKIAMNLDEKFRLWDPIDKTDEANKANGNSEMKSGNNSSSTYGFRSNNPVLQNITDFLIEEASAEEEELLGISGENKDNDGETIERDPQLIGVLDNLILYLRIVHSVDFYNHCEYPYEDEMPNRCGIIHARGPPPSKVAQNDMQDYIKNFENKMQTFLTKITNIDDEELKNLGAKDAEAEVEKFVQANTQELAKDKWLCPLSGKKFKGPEFIRKHIFNKHLEKVDEVRKEVEFFNNYLKDPKRPQLPEHPGANKRTNSESASNGAMGGGGGGYRPPLYPPAYAPPYPTYAPPMMMPGGGGRGGRGFGGGGGRRELPMDHQRRIIGYHDLDAPANFDMFD